MSHAEALGRVAVLGWGNSARGDDALGSLCVERLSARRVGRDWPRLHLVTAQQLQVEHALELAGCRAAIFADAAAELPQAYDFRPVIPAARPSCTTHNLEPAELLAWYERSLGLPAPRGYLLRISGRNFALGRPLSQVAVANLRQALDFLDALLSRLHEADEHVLQGGNDGRDVLNADVVALQSRTQIVQSR